MSNFGSFSYAYLSTSENIWHKHHIYHILYFFSLQRFERIEFHSPLIELAPSEPNPSKFRIHSSIKTPKSFNCSHSASTFADFEHEDKPKAREIIVFSF